MNPYRILSLVVPMLTATFAIAPASATVTATSRESVLNHFRAAGLTAVAAVVTPQEDFSTALGFENGRSLTTADHFLIGSLTKQFTAAGILKLRDQGKLRLGDSVSRYLPAFPHREITLHHLLSHTSGIGEVTVSPRFADLEKNPFHGFARILDLIFSLPTEFPAGERWAYSNSNYILLSAIIETVAGKSWWSFIRQELILPAVMKNTEFHVERGSRVVTGHVFDSENHQNPLPDEAYLERGWAAGAGGLESTVGDLALWNTALYSGRIVSDESLHLMTSPIADTGNGVFYGYGLFIAQDPDTKEQVFYHTGGIPGFTSYNAYYPARKMSVVSIGSIVAREAIDFGKALAHIELTGSADLEAYSDDQRPPSQLDKSIAGRFAPAGASAELEITSEDGGLYVSFPGANTKHRLVIRGDGRYYDRAAGVEFQFDLWNTTGFTLKVGDRLIPHSRVVPASHLAALARSHSR